MSLKNSNLIKKHTMHVRPATGHSPQLLCPAPHERHIKAPWHATDCRLPPPLASGPATLESHAHPSLSPHGTVARLPYISRQRALLQVISLTRASSNFPSSFHFKSFDGLPHNLDNRLSDPNHRSAAPRTEITVVATISAPFR
jgi:hypothetical protein